MEIICVSPHAYFNWKPDYEYQLSILFDRDY